MKVYRITFENFEGEDFIELYHERVNAEARIEKIRLEVLEMEEFNFEIDNKNEYISLSFFDPGLNEYSAYITMEKIDLDELFFD